MTKDIKTELMIIGGGLAGSEAAWQAAQRGIKVHLYEMRPNNKTGAHVSDGLAELVCSNSLGSNLPDKSGGILKNELRQLGSLLMRHADCHSVPAGSALAVDRVAFSQDVTETLISHPNIRVVRKEMRDIPLQPTIIASGPLTSLALSEKLLGLTGQEHLFFFDAIAPIIEADTINMNIVFRASRYKRGDTGEGDYINCPLDKIQYNNFVDALLSGEKIILKDFELELEQGVRAGAENYFEGCLPIEILASRGRNTLAFGPMKPVGLENPDSGLRPYAVLQLRQENLAGSQYNMVGFQTNLKYSEQRKIFRMIPGLEKAEFVRYGHMHRNTFINSPVLLSPSLQYNFREDLFFAGQLIGVEGYVGNIATGLLAGWNAARILRGANPVILPSTTMIGALVRYITQPEIEDFQPMKANFGILPPLKGDELNGMRNKRLRAQAYAKRSRDDLTKYLSTIEYF
jgi:methylenetetrahydrofolate--tRNA-(uracil-5-)-methyltransferase